MSSFTAIALPSEALAAEAARRLEDLHARGSVALFGLCILAREDGGGLVVARPVAPGPIGAATGILVSAVLGCAGGSPAAPPPGQGQDMIGALGALAGLGVGFDFVEECLRATAPGAFLVLAEIGEHWLSPVDAAIADLGATPLRHRRSDNTDQQVRREIEGLDAELRELEQELEQAGGSAGKAVRARAEAARKKLAASVARAEAATRSLREEADARMAALLDQLDRAEAEVEARVEAEARIGQAVARLRAEAARRLATLEKATALARNALGSEG